jgi:hypothetical protein
MDILYRNILQIYTFLNLKNQIKRKKERKGTNETEMIKK